MQRLISTSLVLVIAACTGSAPIASHTDGEKGNQVSDSSKSFSSKVHGAAGQKTLTWAMPPEPCDGILAQQEALSRVNRLRSLGTLCGDRGDFPPAGPLVLNTQLEAAAKRHSADMASHAFFSHRGSDGSSVGDRVKDAGYAWRNVGENIAAGHPTLFAAIEAWIQSPGHCANLMGQKHTEMGIACVLAPAEPSTSKGQPAPEGGLDMGPMPQWTLVLGRR